jgi:hypothetical protein
MHLATRILVLGALVTLGALPALAATTVTLQNGRNGYTGTTDAWLDASQARDNYGGAPDLRVRWYNGRDDCSLVRFDLAGVFPPGSEIMVATLSLYYVSASSFQNDNAVTIRPYRLQASATWYENIYNGQFGAGVSYRYRDASEASEWTGGAEGAWWDKIDDGNGTAKIKDVDGTPPDAVPPGNWVVFDVTQSVGAWHQGATNNGFLLVATAFQGGGTNCYGVFTSRNDGLASTRPKLTITFEQPVETVPTTWGRIKSLYH